jgi:hypothetical protein
VPNERELKKRELKKRTNEEEYPSAELVGLNERTEDE